MSDGQRQLVHYARYCTRGEIIALLYNYAVRLGSDLGVSSDAEISSEDAESLVHAQLLDVRTLDGRIKPNDRGLVNTIKGVTLNVYCCDGAIDVSDYPHGDGRALIKEFISKRLSDLACANVRVANWEPIS